MRSLTWAVTAVLALLPVAASGEELKTTEVAVGTVERLRFEHPASWKVEILPPAVSPTLHFSAAGAAGKGDFSVRITAFPPMHGVPESEHELSSMVRGEGEKLLPTAVQKELEVVPVKGALAVGLVYHLTDRKPESGPGDYREMRQGAVLAGPIYMTVQILTHSDDQATVDAALKMLAAVQKVTPK